MSSFNSVIGPKVHPATREILPDDPMEMHGFEVRGDPELMLRLLVEEYARIGWGIEDIMQLAQDKNYPAFHGLFRMYGEAELRERIAATIARCGVMRVRTREAQPIPETLVQLDLPNPSSST